MSATHSWFAAVGTSPLVRFFHLWKRWLELVVWRAFGCGSISPLRRRIAKKLSRPGMFSRPNRQISISHSL